MDKKVCYLHFPRSAHLFDVATLTSINDIGHHESAGLSFEARDARESGLESVWVLVPRDTGRLLPGHRCRWPVGILFLDRGSGHFHEDLVGDVPDLFGVHHVRRVVESPVGQQRRVRAAGEVEVPALRHNLGSHVGKFIVAASAQQQVGHAPELPCV